MISDGMVVGLGSGRAATRFIRALGARVAEGLHVRGVPTSQSTAALASELGIPLTTLDELETIDIAVDGADEVDPQLNLIKGLGGALVREKIVAAAARRLVILVGPEKLVSQLGERGALPVEVVPFAVAYCRRKLESLGYAAIPRCKDGRLFTTDNGNQILDCRIAPLVRSGRPRSDDSRDSRQSSAPACFSAWRIPSSSIVAKKLRFDSARGSTSRMQQSQAAGLQATLAIRNSLTARGAGSRRTGISSRFGVPDSAQASASSVSRFSSRSMPER